MEEADTVEEGESPTKYDLSFSFDFDVDEVESSKSSTSETTGLEIDVSEVKNYDTNKQNKRKITVQDTSMIDEMEEEIERQLDAKAAKTNLTATNVKNILRHVITNEHVMAMVNRRLNKTTDDDGMIFEPKLTRSKAKELGALGHMNIPWPTTPVKTASAEVQVLIEQELPEDSSDEEYKPEPDDDKDEDDEREADHSIGSDVDSQPSTPATPLDHSSSQESHNPEDVHYDSEGVFKIPEIPHVATQEESIGQRTRSKLCLSETPLEYIEQSFIPPDITTDMYDYGADIDEEWKNFLQGFTQPLTQEINAEDDPEADPEYNILEEDEAELLDKEEFRIDRAVKVSRKEVNNLMEELLEYANDFANTQSMEKPIENQETPRKKRSNDFITTPIENNPMNTSVELLTVLSESELPKFVNYEQRQLLTIQMRQHVQLMTQQFLMCYKHPDHHNLAKTCKSNLDSVRYLSSGPNSAFNVETVNESLQLVADWEDNCQDEKFAEEYHNFLTREIQTGVVAKNRRQIYIYKFHPKLKKLIMESKALSYPSLLPHVFSRPNVDSNKCRSLFNSEENLIALGLEQFQPLVMKKKKVLHKYTSYLIHDIVAMIHTYLLSPRDRNTIYSCVQRYRRPGGKGPIKHFFETGKAPVTLHVISPEFELRAPQEQPIGDLPELWQQHLKKLLQMQQPVIHYQVKQVESEKFAVSKSAIEPGSHLLNPIVNMMPTISLSRRKRGRKKATPKAAAIIQMNPVPLPEESTIENMEIGVSLQMPEIDNDSSEIQETDDQRFETDNERLEIQETDNQRFEIREAVKNPRFVIKENENHEFVIQKIDNQRFEIEEADNQGFEIQDTDNQGFEIQEADNQRFEIQETDNQNFEIQDNDNQRLPQLRKTTPRLAKTRSAQNIKSMTQLVAGKELSSSSIKAKTKAESLKSSSLSSSSSVKGDNEDEIAELMLASTTIKKNALSRKKAKQARELENIKRLIDSENELNAEERATKFAASYLQKIHSTLESSDPETFKAIIKLFLDYSEKLDNIIQAENENEMKTDDGRSEQSAEKRIKAHDLKVSKDIVAVNFYQGVCDKLDNYPDMCSDFLLFLNSQQAGMVNKSIEWIMLQKMQEFVQVAQVYFAKQPSRLTKVMQSISQLAAAPYTPLKNVFEAISPILKGSPLVMDLFLQVFPMGKPPESLFAPQFFENITCPVGPHDKSKTCTIDAPDLYENIELPVSTSQEDPYGGENCKCTCHEVADAKLKSGNEHCASCGTRFLNGRIYLQTTEGLRPAKITFPGENDEKLENIARVSLKPAEKFMFAPPQQKRRRKSSKNDPVPEETSSKQPSTFKISPVKEAPEESAEKLGTKPKRGPRSPPKAAALPSTSGVKRTILICKTKREQRAQKRDAKQEKMSLNSSSESCDSGLNKSQQMEENQEHSNSKIEIFMDDDDKTNESSDSDSSLNAEIEESVEIRPWSRQEDAILLQSIKKEYSEKTFIAISQTLENRTVQQVKDRCQMLLSLLEKIS